eukprot:3638348-Pleurochrysis_carterae.AAC.4
MHLVFLHALLGGSRADSTARPTIHLFSYLSYPVSLALCQGSSRKTRHSAQDFCLTAAEKAGCSTVVQECPHAEMPSGRLCCQDLVSLIGDYMLEVRKIKDTRKSECPSSGSREFKF